MSTSNAIQNPTSIAIPATVDVDLVEAEATVTVVCVALGQVVMTVTADQVLGMCLKV